MTIGDRIRRERERLGMTIPAFAVAASAGKNTVIDWQNAKSTPTAEKLAALALAGVDVQYVLIGVRSVPHYARDEDGVRRANELIENFFAMPEDDQDKVLAWTLGLVQRAVDRGDAVGIRRRKPEGQLPRPSPSAGPQPSVHEEPAAQVFHGPVGQAGAGDIVNHAPVTIKQRAK